MADDRPFLPATEQDDTAARRAASEQWMPPAGQFVQARQGNEDYPSNFYQQRPPMRNGTPDGRQETPIPEGGRATYGPSGTNLPRGEQSDPRTAQPALPDLSRQQLPPQAVNRERIAPPQRQLSDTRNATGGIFNFGTAVDYGLTGGAVWAQQKYRLPEKQKIVGTMTEETELALDKSLQRYHSVSTGYLKMLQDRFEPLEKELSALAPKGTDLRDLANDEALSKAFRETLDPPNQMKFDQYRNFAKEWNKVGEWTLSTEVPANKFDLKAGTPPKPSIPYETVIGTSADNPWSVRRASLEGIGVQNFEKAAGTLAGDLEKATTEKFSAGNKLTNGFWTKAGVGYGLDVLYDLNSNKKPAGIATWIADVSSTFALLKPWGLIKTTAVITGAHILGRNLDNTGK